MATTKEIELILQARLEQGNAIDNAKALGVGIADSLEHAFDGLGERIAAKMMMELKTSLGGLKLSELFDSSGMTGPGQGAMPVPSQSQYSLIDGVWQNRQPSGGAITDISGAPISSGAARPQGPNLPGGAEQASQTINENDNRQHNDVPHRRPRFGNNYSAAPFMGIEGPLTDGFAQAQGTAKKDQALDMDQVIAKFRAFDTLRKIDPDFKMDPALREQVGNAKKFAIAGAGDEAQSISKLADEIVALQKAIELNSESVKAATGKKENERSPEEKGTIKDQAQRQADVFNKMDDVESRQQHMRDTENFTKKVSAFETEETNKQAEQKRSRASNMAKGLGVAGAAVGAVGNFIGNLDQMRLDSAAGTAQFENANLRDFMGGDISSMMATQSLGGEEELNSRSKSNAYWKSGGKMIGGALGVAGSAVGGIAAGWTGVGAVAAGAAGLTSAKFAADGFSEFMTIDKQAANNAAAMKQAEMEKQKEYMMMTQQAMGTSIGSYNTAQAMGSPEMSNVLFGVGGTSGLNENSMRSKAVKGGLSNAQFDGYTQSTMASMGGQFMGTQMFRPGVMKTDERTPMRDAGLQDQMLKSMKLKADGFTNIESIQGSLFNQGQGGGVADRERSMKEAAALYGEAVGANMDKLKIPQYLEQMANRMAASGTGSEGYEKNLISKGLAATQEIYGKGALEGKNVMNVQGALDNMYDKARGNDTLSTYAGMKTVNSINKELGTKLGSPEEIYLRTKKYDASNKDDVKSVQKFLNAEGGKTSLETTKKIMEKFQEKIIGENDKTTNFMTPKMKILARTAGQETAQASDIYEQTFQTQVKGGGRPTIGAVIPEGGPKPVGEKERQILEEGKAAMLATGFNALGDVVVKLTGQMEGLITKMKGYGTLEASVIAPDAMQTPQAKAEAAKAQQDRDYKKITAPWQVGVPKF